MALVFLIHPVVILWRPDSQLGDPGIGWHLATGRYILGTWTIPHHDLFSFTAVDHVWITYYWLFEVAAAFLVRLGGLPLYATACMLVYAFVPVLIFRRMLRIGANPLVALGMTLVAYAVLRSHGQARPHIMTYLFFALVLERLDDVQAGRRPERSLWWLPLLTILWCNMHGGFVAGLTAVAIFAGVAGIRGLALHDEEERRRAGVFGTLLVAMTLATCVNPNGPQLLVDIVRHLRQSSIGYFVEFQSPNFLTPSLSVKALEGLLLSIVLVVGIGKRRLSWVEVVLVVFFAHEALQSQRHASLFAIVAAPILAREITAWLNDRWPSVHRRWQVIAADQMALRSASVYLPALCVLFVGLAVLRKLPLPENLDGLQLTRGAAEFVSANREHFARPFNTDNLGGALIYRFWPDLHVYVDDRIFVYGEHFIAHDYLTVFLGRREWREVLASHDVTAAIVATGAPCATLFRESDEWSLRYEDERTLILFRRSEAR